MAIDWSGAKGERLGGLAVATCTDDGAPPRLAEPPHSRWSRRDILHLLEHDLADNTLVGLDLGIALPFIDAGAYFPGMPASPPDAPALWALVDSICAHDEHLAATSFVDHSGFARYFRRHGGREGKHFGGGRGRFRITERAQELQGCKPYSNFNLVGAAQVGKSSLTGMRMLHRLRGYLPVWPIDPLPASGSVIVEIYTALAAIAGGRTASASKMRDRDALNIALAVLGSPPVEGAGKLSDHAADALLTAAWLRANAARKELWQPDGLSPHIARTEGWTFGVV